MLSHSRLIMKYIYKKIPNSTTATIRIIVNSGSDAESVPGTAHFLEHMLFKGTKDNTYEEINKTISKLGSTNAYTSTNKTVFYIVTTADGIKKATETLLEIVTRPAFYSHEFEKEKGVILEEFTSSRDDPLDFLYNSAAFEMSNHVAHPIIGNEDTISFMTLEHIKKFYDVNYTKNNICINVVGNLSKFSEAALKKVIQSYESNLPEGELMKPVEFILNEHYALNTGSLNNPFVLNLDFPCQQNYATLWFDAPDVKDNLEKNFISELFCNMVGNGFHSLFFNKLREELALCYDCSIYVDTIGTQKKFLAYAALGEHNIEKCLLEIKNILAGIASGNFSEEILEISKANTAFNMASRMQTPSGQAAILDDIFEYERLLPDFRLESYSYEDFKDAINKISKEDVQNFASEILKSNFDVVVLRGELNKPTFFERIKNLFRGEWK